MSDAFVRFVVVVVVVVVVVLFVLRQVASGFSDVMN